MFKNEHLMTWNIISPIQLLDALSGLVKDREITHVHYQHMKGFPIEIAVVFKQMGLVQLLSVHDYHYVCEEHFLESHTLMPCTVPKEISECTKCLHNKYNMTPREVVQRRDSMAMFLSYMDTIIFPARCVRSDYVRVYPHIQDKSHVIPISITSPFVESMPIDVSSETLSIGIPSHITYIKGYIPMLNTIRYAEQHFDNLQFHMMCTSMERSIENYLSKFSNVTLYTKPQDPTIDLIWLPTIARETFSLVVSETLSHQHPLIVRESPIMKERLTEEEAYFYGADFTPKDIAYLLESISREKDELDKKRIFIKNSSVSKLTTPEMTKNMYIEKFVR
jgi:hypothetical protein